MSGHIDPIIPPSNGAPVSPIERLEQLSLLVNGVSFRGRLAASTGSVANLTLIGTALADQAVPRNITVLNNPDHDATFLMQAAADAARSPNGTDLDVSTDSAIWYLAFRTTAGTAVTLTSKRDPAGTNQGIRIQLDANGRAVVVLDFGANNNLIGLATGLADGAFHGIGVLVNQSSGRAYLADDFEPINRILTLSQAIIGGSLANTEPFGLGAGDTATGADAEFLYYAQWPNTNGQLDSWDERDLFDLMVGMRSGVPPGGGTFTGAIDGSIA